MPHSLGQGVWHPALSQGKCSCLWVIVLAEAEVLSLGQIQPPSKNLEKPSFFFPFSSFSLSFSPFFYRAPLFFPFSFIAKIGIGPDGTRTRNLRLRRATPYPLGHRSGTSNTRASYIFKLPWDHCCHGFQLLAKDTPSGV